MGDYLAKVRVLSRGIAEPMPAQVKIYFFLFFCNRRYSLLSFGGPQLYNSEALPFTYMLSVCCYGLDQNQLTNSINPLLCYCFFMLCESISFTQVANGFEHRLEVHYITLIIHCCISMKLLKSFNTHILINLIFPVCKETNYSQLRMHLDLLIGHLGIQALWSSHKVGWDQ